MHTYLLIIQKGNSPLFEIYRLSETASYLVQANLWRESSLLTKKKDPVSTRKANFKHRDYHNKDMYGLLWDFTGFPMPVVRFSWGRRATSTGIDRRNTTPCQPCRICFTACLVQIFCLLNDTRNYVIRNSLNYSKSRKSQFIKLKCNDVE